MAHAGVFNDCSEVRFLTAFHDCESVPLSGVLRPFETCQRILDSITALNVFADGGRAKDLQQEWRLYKKSQSPLVFEEDCVDLGFSIISVGQRPHSLASKLGNDILFFAASHTCAARQHAALLIVEHPKKFDRQLRALHQAGIAAFVISRDGNGAVYNVAGSHTVGHWHSILDRNGDRDHQPNGPHKGNVQSTAPSATTVATSATTATDTTTATAITTASVPTPNPESLPNTSLMDLGHQPSRHAIDSAIQEIVQSTSTADGIANADDPTAHHGNNNNDRQRSMLLDLTSKIVEDRSKAKTLSDTAWRPKSRMHLDNSSRNVEQAARASMVSVRRSQPRKCSVPPASRPRSGSLSRPAESQCDPYRLVVGDMTRIKEQVFTVKTATGTFTMTRSDMDFNYSWLDRLPIGKQDEQSGTPVCCRLHKSLRVTDIRLVGRVDRIVRNQYGFIAHRLFPGNLYFRFADLDQSSTTRDDISAKGKGVKEGAIVAFRVGRKDDRVWALRVWEVPPTTHVVTVEQPQAVALPNAKYRPLQTSHLNGNSQPKLNWQQKKTTNSCRNSSSRWHQ